MLRRLFFWLHLIAGLLAGLIIALKCLTGVALGFEKDLVAWAERDVRVVAVAQDATPLPLANQIAAARAAREDKSPSGITLSASPAAALAVQFGRDDTVYVNPYTAEVRPPAPSSLKSALHTAEELHRWLALSGTGRDWGKGIGGAANLLFLFLALSGLILWWPRSLSWRGFRAVVKFNLRLQGKARDWNWHTTLGFWATPLLLLITISAIPMSYRWGANAVFGLFGEQPPQQGQAPGKSPEVPRPAEGTKRLSQAELLVFAAQASPGFEQLSLRQENGNRRPQGGQPPAASPESRPARSGPQAVTVQVKEANAWPRTATTTLYLNPFNGDLLKTERFSDQTPGQRLRHWLRFLHTGEALGWPGQLALTLACAIGTLLVYTGFALSWRRFFGKRQS
jgi:uncharacterized iron-regulated membrane protein